jgi:hypothetical protein
MRRSDHFSGSKQFFCSFLASLFSIHVLLASPLEEFRGFMSGLPPAGRIVFSVSFPNGTNEFHNYQWGPDFFLVMIADDAEKILAERPSLRDTKIGGRNGTKFWRLLTYSGETPTFLAWDSEKDAGSLKNPVSETLITWLFHSKAVLCMGISHLEPGSLKWSGNRFDFDNNGMHLSGNLLANQYGRAASMNLTIRKEQERHFQIFYNYGGNEIPSWMPNEIQLALREGNGIRLLQKYSVLIMSAAPEPGQLTPEYFYQGSPIIKGMVISNDIYLEKNGAMKRLPNAGEVDEINPGGVKPEKGFIFKLIILLLVGSVPVVIYQINKKS